MIPEDTEADITRVAATVARANPPVEADDIAQELRLHYLGLSEKQKDVGSKILTEHFYGHARAWAKGERAEWNRESVHYYYTPSDVKTILKSMFSYSLEDLVNGFVPDDARSVGAPNGVDALDLVLDVSSVLDDIATADSNIISWAYADDRDRDLTTSEKGQLRRAIQRLTVQMNTLKKFRDGTVGDGEYEGMRTAVSNATAREIARGQW